MRLFTLSSSARVALSRACGCSKVAPAISSSQGVVAKSFSSLPSLRPTLQPRLNTVFRSSILANPAPTVITSPADSATLDIVPKSAITSNPALFGVQIRCGPRPTMARTSRLVRKRRHGFLSRIQTRTGRRTLQRRKSKGRKMLSN
ncbi:uncharacterized protein BCR38DRAFT_417715 [Pseudomassariella vexata]|uniref:Ribosomal protein L34-domain-containing protein n=1 Tax=Pseudomassariella vexata TaxID=1141098 RepID=A0A1Y2EK50_9PEZI|nr:uncharacterized protein BCR38DRAFT_417715 [Pseudomassariella vexata]ORY71676.1 hypothetical protein BCR38DRAFT_417715 [Pseudomassariella vexata]